MSSSTPSWSIEKFSPSAFTLKLGKEGGRVLQVSDLHWDNQHCDRVALKRDLDEAAAEGAPIVLVGDTFCAMQGKWDKRKDEKQLRPEHRGGNYFDKLVDTAAEWFAPYAAHVALITYGNHECLDAETEVLTRDGWIKIPEVTLAHEVAMMPPVGSNLVFARPVKTHSFNYVGKMVHIETRGVDMLMTPNHRIAYRLGNDRLSYVTAEQFVGRADARVKVPTCGKTLSDGVSLSDDEIRLAAWILTDGGVSNGVSIYQSKPEMCSRIRAMLDRLGVSYTHTVRERKIDSVCGVKLKKDCLPQQVFYLKAENDIASKLDIRQGKPLPEWTEQMSQSQFEIFLNELVLGDGSKHVSSATSWMLYGKESFLSQVQKLCTTHNVRATLSHRKRNGAPSYFVLNITHNTVISLQSKHAKLVEWDGPVYCLTTPAGNFFARRGGRAFLTGNSSIVQHHNTDLLQRFHHELTHAKGFRGELGAYAGFLKVTAKVETSTVSRVICWNHGNGGGGEVTRGMIDNNRSRGMAFADIYVGGHIHRRNADENVILELDERHMTIRQRTQWFLRSSTYKKESGVHEQNLSGFHVEKRGAGERPIGGWWLEFYPVCNSSGSREQRRRAYDLRFRPTPTWA